MTKNTNFTEHTTVLTLFNNKVNIDALDQSIQIWVTSFDDLATNSWHWRQSRLMLVATGTTYPKETC